MDKKSKIILYLAKKQDFFTIHELSKLTNIPYTSLHRTIKDMEDITSIKNKGKSKLIHLKWNEITKAYLIIASHKEKKESLKKHDKLKKINERAKDITLIFGSYAKGKERKGSDIDVMVINKKGEKNIRFSELEILYDVKINPIFISEKEFLKMLKEDDENVAKQALKDHILLCGFSEFWRLVENEKRQIREKIQ